ncbi:hypothetical protein Pan181_51520 [Aeoliella mucimassa]|uniref:Uncharacterized protein n=1 Tax=Aeoliella mucimassa TaxID=2527972 RepID=A0A518AW42_9BACT|nr:hypothetical protein Pan181_51520 [Aeoliella mucimassa]
MQDLFLATSERLYLLLTRETDFASFFLVNLYPSHGLSLTGSGGDSPPLLGSFLLDGRSHQMDDSHDNG